MALIKTILSQKAQVFADQGSPLFEGFPGSIKDNADKWAGAIDSYANSIESFVTPLSLSGVIAKKVLLDIMNNVTEPPQENPNPFPFTIYYRSPEIRMRVFNSYLRDVVGYKSNPLLDKSEIFTILNNIRVTYNKLKPTLALTEDDIRYNQKRFNQIFEKDISNSRRFKLLPDGVTIDSKGLPYLYKFIPLDKDGIIIELQVDGIIGDDTIRYYPIEEFRIYEGENPGWELVYSKLKYITQPSTAGGVYIAYPQLIGNHYHIRDVIQHKEPGIFKKDFIDKKLSPDYINNMIDKTQAQYDGNIFDKTPVVSTVNDFKKVFELNHSTCDQIWLKNNIKTLTDYSSFLKSKKITFNTKPTVEKNALSALETGITAYATALGLGMNPSFTGAPSSSPLSFKSVISKGKSGGSNKECLDLMINLIDTYFKGGIATNNSTGASIPWQ
jgi:hypothetical protein